MSTRRPGGARYLDDPPLWFRLVLTILTCLLMLAIAQQRSGGLGAVALGVFTAALLNAVYDLVQAWPGSDRRRPYIDGSALGPTVLFGLAFFSTLTLAWASVGGIGATIAGRRTSARRRSRRW